MNRKYKNRLPLCTVVLTVLITVMSMQGMAKEKTPVTFTAFFATPGIELTDDNEIQKMIAEKTGVIVNETWLSGQTAAEAIGTIIASGEYPDFINGIDAMYPLYEAEALVAWDDYIENYPNIRDYYTEEEWEKFRQEDGHIYWMNPFQNVHGEEKTTTHNDEAVWIQTRVLKWAGYPKIETYEQYFTLLDAYMKANPVMENGLENIPYTILCDDWRYFCLENAPQFLAGYPNDGSVIVEPESVEVLDFNVTETAKRYFQILNEQYHAGNVDPESFTQTYDEYIAKLSSGRVLGMIDQWWNFAYTVNDALKHLGLDTQGCNYVPLGLTIDPGMENQWHTPGKTINTSNGIAITKDCENIEMAFAFIDALLSQELHNLRFWGIEDTDYCVNENGLFYRTPEQRMRTTDSEYKASHMCYYSYFPQWHGTSCDGINAMQPLEQPSEFLDSLSVDVRECFEAYGVSNYVEMLASVDKTGPWFPMYSYSNTLTTETPGGVAWKRMVEVKQEWLPIVVMAEDFEAAWEAYLQAYQKCQPQDFLEQMQLELERRMALVENGEKNG